MVKTQTNHHGPVPSEDLRKQNMSREKLETWGVERAEVRKLGSCSTTGKHRGVLLPSGTLQTFVIQTQAASPSCFSLPRPQLAESLQVLAQRLKEQVLSPPATL